MKSLFKIKNCVLPTNNTSGQINAAIILLFLVFFGLFIASFTALKSPLLVLGLACGLIVALITFLNTDLALIILIFSMLLSPEIPIAKLTERAVVIRIDDILIIFIFFAWLAKLAINKEFGLLKKTPVNKPLGVYIFIYLFSTILGIAQGRLLPVQSLFYVLKYTEYFIIFFIFVNNTRSLRQIRVFVFVLLLTCSIVCIIALATRSYYGRASTPFEGEKGEPNTLGGYLVLISAVTIGQLIYCNSRAYRLFLLCLIFLIIPTFFFTLSRGAYIGFTAMYLVLTALTKKAKMALLGILLVAALFIFFTPGIIPHEIIERVESTFSGQQEYSVLGQKLKLEASAAQRVIVWGWIFEKWQKHPLFGWGVTGLGLVDNQYSLIIGETGIIGMFAFIWLVITILVTALKITGSVKIEELKGLGIAFIASFIGLLIHSFAGNILIIVRIMEPFWFLTAMVVTIPEVMAQET